MLACLKVAEAFMAVGRLVYTWWRIEHLAKITFCNNYISLYAYGLTQKLQDNIEL